MSDRRALVLLVGPDSPRRRHVAAELLGRGRSVVVCDGPPGCSLLRQDACIVVEESDVVVLLSPRTIRRETVVALGLCARSARHSIVTRPTSKPSAIADAVESVLSATV